MVVRAWLSNKFVGFGRKIGRADGQELMVDLSEHSISVGMVDPERDDLAWDDSLYRHGNVFLKGYANPIKPTVTRHNELEEPDTAEIEEIDSEATDAVSAETDGGEDGHVKLISSARFGEFMRQQLIESLLNPREQWRLLMYAMIGLGALQFLTMIVTLYATGSF